MSSAKEQFLDAWAATVAATAQRASRQESTVATTPKQVDLAIAMKRALADMIAEGIDRSVVADRIERVSAELVVSLREQIHTVVDAA